MSGSSTESGPQKQLAGLVYLSPIMMGLFSFSAPAALPLYWTVGGVFMIGQTYLAHWIYARRKAKEIVPIVDVKSANS
ncbi:Membrane protein insertase MisCA precursor [compost metagenome]